MKAAEAVKESAKALEAWQLEAKKYGDSSLQAHKAGGQAIYILVKHIEYLKIFTEKYNARPLTQQIIIQLDTIKESFSKKEILSMGGDVDYWFYTQEDFLKDLKRWAASDKAGKTKQNSTPAKIINIEHFQGVLGDVQQPENLQIGDHTSIHKHDRSEGKKKGIIGKILKIIGVIIGWLEPIKAFIYKILLHK